jgi:hypothetical protein
VVKQITPFDSDANIKNVVELVKAGGDQTAKRLEMRLHRINAIRVDSSALFEQPVNVFTKTISQNTACHDENDQSVTILSQTKSSRKTNQTAKNVEVRNRVVPYFNYDYDHSFIMHS